MARKRVVTAKTHREDVQPDIAGVPVSEWPDWPGESEQRRVRLRETAADLPIAPTAPTAPTTLTSAIPTSDASIPTAPRATAHPPARRTHAPVTHAPATPTSPHRATTSTGTIGTTGEQPAPPAARRRPTRYSLPGQTLTHATLPPLDAVDAPTTPTTPTAPTVPATPTATPPDSPTRPGPRVRVTASPDIITGTHRATALPRTTGAPRTTGEHPAAPLAPAASDMPDASEPTRRRRITSARPIRPEDTALVSKTTQIMRALAVVQDDVAASTSELAAVQPGETTVVAGELVDDLPAETRVTLVPATVPPAPVWMTPVVKPLRPRHHRRTLIAGAATALTVVALVLGVLMSATPTGAAPTLDAFNLALENFQGQPNPAMPNGPWDTGAAATLGLGGGAAPGTSAPGSAGLPVTKKSTTSDSTASGPKTTISAAPLSPWPPKDQFHTYPPGYKAKAIAYPSDNYYYWTFGQCTWWAQNERRDENLRYMGNAMYWASSAKKRGYRVGNTPAVGATVVFQPGVQGAGGAGHVAHVLKVYPGGWFLVSEMNFYWNGGGWGRVDYRYAHSGSGVSFIY